METTIVYRGNIGIVDKKMEIAIVYRGNIGNNEKENGNHCSTLGFHKFG